MISHGIKTISSNALHRFSNLNPSLNTLQDRFETFSFPKVNTAPLLKHLPCKPSAWKLVAVVSGGNVGMVCAVVAGMTGLGILGLGVLGACLIGIGLLGAGYFKWQKAEKFNKEATIPEKCDIGNTDLPATSTPQHGTDTNNREVKLNQQSSLEYKRIRATWAMVHGQKKLQQQTTRKNICYSQIIERLFPENRWEAVKKAFDSITTSFTDESCKRAVLDALACFEQKSVNIFDKKDEKSEEYLQILLKCFSSNHTLKDDQQDYQQQVVTYFQSLCSLSITDLRILIDSSLSPEEHERADEVQM